MMRDEFWDKYAHTTDGKSVPEIEGWTILEEGVRVPQAHREFIEDYSTGRSRWAAPRRCLGTMTAIDAMVWGGVRAYAVPVEEKPK